MSAAIPNGFHGPVASGRAYWDKKPGWVQDEIKAMRKRRTDWQFMSATCGHSAKHAHGDRCKGVGHTIGPRPPHRRG